MATADFNQAVAETLTRQTAKISLLQQDRVALVNRFEAAVRMCYPDDMTPNAKRVFDSIIEDERAKR